MIERTPDERWDFKYTDTKELTHCYHTYPAMMIPQVARRLIGEFAPGTRCEMLFDPYMGSGTSLVEASVCGIRAIGTDLNPLAQMIARTKTTHFDAGLVRAQWQTLRRRVLEYRRERVCDMNFDRISNASYWYDKEVLLRLAYLSQTIDGELAPEVRDFFRLVLAETVRESSYTRNGEFKRYRMDETKIATFRPDVFGMFDEKASRNLRGLESFNESAFRPDIGIYGFNPCVEVPRSIVPRDSVDLVVTSPPYGDSRTTVAYGQFSRWANEWFGFEHAADLDALLMGGKRQFEELFAVESVREELDTIRSLDEKRYCEVISFLNDYRASIRNVAATVRPGGRVCYVVGNRTVKGIRIPLDRFTAEAFEQEGFVHEHTFVRGIPNKRMPLRTSPTNKRGEAVETMNCEYIVIATKQ